MNPDRDDIERLRTLPFWRGPITVEPMTGGITNRNYLVRAAGGSFVARLNVGREPLGIDRRNEVVCQRAAHALGVAPAVVHHEDGVLVSEYLSARTMGPAGVRDPAFVPRLAAVLRASTTVGIGSPGRSCISPPFRPSGRTPPGRGRWARGCRATWTPCWRTPGDWPGGSAPFVPVLCHNDLLAANLLDDGRRVWLVDWEYAGVGHPLFDLAGVSANCGFSAAEDATLLAAYRGTPGRSGPPRTLGS